MCTNITGLISSVRIRWTRKVLVDPVESELKKHPRVRGFGDILWLVMAFGVRAKDFICIF